MGNTIIIADKMCLENPFRHTHLKNQYSFAKDKALQDFIGTHQNAHFSLREVFSESVKSGFEEAKKVGATAVVGYLYSTEAVVASEIAQREKIYYVSPVSPLDVVSNNFARSMAASHSLLEGEFKKVSSERPHRTFLITQTSSLANYKVASIFREAFRIEKEYSVLGSDVDPTIIANDINQSGSPVNILLAGFAWEQIDLVIQLSGLLKQEVNFITHPQWTYCTLLIEKALKGKKLNLYALTDMLDYAGISDADPGYDLKAAGKYKHLKDALPKDNSVADEPLFYALYDSIMIALELSFKSGTDVAFFSDFEYTGVAGRYRLVGGFMQKKVYLAKWHEKSFKTIKEI